MPKKPPHKLNIARLEDAQRILENETMLFKATLRRGKEVEIINWLETGLANLQVALNRARRGR